MQTFSFAPQNGPPRDGQKNYVFVDEHNRHKRLKVMRACNGCRKRKIKCDAATSNIWPCSACTRLKLVCVPPTIVQDGGFPSNGQQPDPGLSVQPPMGLSKQPSFEVSPQEYISQQSYGDPNSHLPPAEHTGSFSTDTSGVGLYTPQQSYVAQPGDQHQMYQSMPQQMTYPQQSFHQTPPIFQTPPPKAGPSSDSGAFIDPDQSTAENLTEALGELKIDETGVAPYIRKEKQGVSEPEAPVQDEWEDDLPPLSTGAGSTVRIPPELMPSDEDVMNYFDIYFTNIHPYVPVIHRGHMYRQWQKDRSSISPLLLEALFACAGRMSDDPSQGAQWLGMANRHESTFMDVPRLSTIQALLLLLKAREAAPKAGYYYRSWQTVKTMVSMAKDLDLHEHLSAHSDDKPCNLDPVECLVQTRIWQTLLVVEIMIGGPQGRSDFGVDLDTVDTNPVPKAPGLDKFEMERSRQFVYWIRNVHNIRLFTESYHKTKKQKDWGANPKFVGNNPLFNDWLANLPPDLQVCYPQDGSPPWLPSHFLGNMHSHFHLGIIMLHRPQLLASKPFAAGGAWKSHMSLCYSSAKALCRLQESILASFGLNGLLYMQRGINFTIYSILTCTMLHLVAITSPDPDFHTDARDYFTRHMRILEQCASAWPLSEMKRQIDSLRLAFSADINRPFVLKPTFPYGSPSEPYHPSPPAMESLYPPSSYQTTHDQSRLAAYHPITPPISAGAGGSKPDSPQLQTLVPMTSNQAPPAQQSMGTIPLVDNNSWDPTRIINQWDMAFSGDAASAASSSPPVPMQNPGSSIAGVLPNQYPMQYANQQKMDPVTPSQSMPQQTGGPGMPVFISARDWQRSVASVYDPEGSKRKWGYTDMGAEHAQKRR
ncbi:hypothetical protein FQN54_003172 [Arachnomyces sp. PD_36]|nr:hypothetical protein FQN54_003172 [Arachnomyces sp. PD_36]